jgi:hypothetical protein
MQSFYVLYHKDPEKYKFILNSKKETLIEIIFNQHDKYFKKLNDSNDKFPELLKNIEIEFKKHLGKTIY